MSSKKNNKLRKRFKKEASVAFKSINSSVEIDKFLFREDIDGSIAHAKMLESKKLFQSQILKKFLLD